MAVSRTRVSVLESALYSTCRLTPTGVVSLYHTDHYYKRIDLCRSGSSPYPFDSKYKGTPVITSKNVITIMFMIPSNKQVRKRLVR